MPSFHIKPEAVNAPTLKHHQAIPFIVRESPIAIMPNMINEIQRTRYPSLTTQLTYRYLQIHKERAYLTRTNNGWVLGPLHEAFFRKLEPAFPDTPSWIKKAFETPFWVEYKRLAKLDQPRAAQEEQNAN